MYRVAPVALADGRDHVLLDVADGSVCDTPFAPERVPLTGRHLGGAFVDGGSSRVAHSRDLCCHLGHAEIRSPALLWVGAIDGFGHSLAPSTFHRSEMTTSPPLGRRWVISTRGTGDAAEVRRPIDSSAMRMTVCHERGWRLRCRGSCRWLRCRAGDGGLALRDRPAGGGLKPPQAAAVKSRGGERCGKGAPDASGVIREGERE
jgi:hypothetical protein